VTVIFLLGVTAGIYFVASGHHAGINEALAQDSPNSFAEVSPTQARERDYYVPNSESLKPDEMRVIACGTGMPTTRAAQAAACFLVELGNGDKFLFDIGSGSAERISSLQIPYNFLDKVFIGHLHTDHFGALHDLFIGGALMGRNVPLRVWGPSALTPEPGTKHALDGMLQMLNWDLAGRAGQSIFAVTSLMSQSLTTRHKMKLFTRRMALPFVRSLPYTQSTVRSASH